MTTVVVPSGIGDILWILAKLQHVGRFSFIVPDAGPHRADSLLSLLPHLAQSIRYEPEWTYRKILVQNDARHGRAWSELSSKPKIVLSANEHLEGGKRLEMFLPDLPYAYVDDFRTTAADRNYAERVLSQGMTIGIYTSSLSNSHAHGGWELDQWLYFCARLGLLRPNFVLIGAEYDRTLTIPLASALAQLGFACKEVVGRPLGSVIEVLRGLTYFVGFPSGLSVIREMLRQDGLMFYGFSQSGIIGAWAEPERIQAGKIYERLFLSPADASSLVLNHLQGRS